MPTQSLTALVLTHVAFEDLDSLAVHLLERNFNIEVIDVATACFPLPQAETCDLLVVLGGPIGVYDQQHYPFLADEIACIRKRLSMRKPTLGICLGAQLMAAALGARVYPGKNGAEIGWLPIQPASQNETPEWFAPLLAADVSLVHWHGDTFDLPPGAQHLAKSERYPNQAFAIEDFALALQFHAEVTATGLERWYVGHACELHHAGITPESLRVDAQKHAPALEQAAAKFWCGWLDYIL
jgi:GMP synthase (glutamine-hydrolysing)